MTAAAGVIGPGLPVRRLAALFVDQTQEHQMRAREGVILDSDGTIDGVGDDDDLPETDPENMPI